MIKDLFGKLIKPSILFESIPPFSDNTRAVFDEMVSRGLNKKYRFIWYVDYNKAAFLKNGIPKYWDPYSRNTIKKKILNYSLFYRTKCIICCNHFITTEGRNQYTCGKGQKAFYLSHGSPIKSVKNYYTCPGPIDYCLSPSKEFDDIMAYEFSFSKDRIFTAGFPRNDVFAGPKIDLKAKLKTDCSKVIIWYPTYRQRKDKEDQPIKDTFPIIKNNDELTRELNETARKHNVLIVMKPHFVQDTSRLKDLHLSNILLINDEFFLENGFSSYEMLAASDGLITDYSSVYFDYTLCDKPIGVIWEDIDEYRANPGFAIDLDKYLKGAVKIYNMGDFKAFIADVAEGNDRLREERREIRDLTNYSVDGQNAKRVVDFIVEKAKL